MNIICIIVIVTPRYLNFTTFSNDKFPSRKVIKLLELIWKFLNSIKLSVMNVSSLIYAITVPRNVFRDEKIFVS